MCDAQRSIDERRTIASIDTHTRTAYYYYYSSQFDFVQNGFSKDINNIIISLLSFLPLFGLHCFVSVDFYSIDTWARATSDHTILYERQSQSHAVIERIHFIVIGARIVGDRQSTDTFVRYYNGICFV